MCIAGLLHSLTLHSPRSQLVGGSGEFLELGCTSAFEIQSFWTPFHSLCKSSNLSPIVQHFNTSIHQPQHINDWQHNTSRNRLAPVCQSSGFSPFRPRPQHFNINASTTTQDASMKARQGTNQKQIMIPTQRIFTSQTLLINCQNIAQCGQCAAIHKKKLRWFLDDFAPPFKHRRKRKNVSDFFVYLRLNHIMDSFFRTMSLCLTARGRHKKVIVHSINPQ